MVKKIMFFLTTIFFITTLFLGYQKFILGDSEQREKLLSAVVWHLTKEGYSVEDIKELDVSYDPYKGGERPYAVFVTFKKDPSVIEIYKWTNSKQEEVTKIGTTVP